MSLCQLPSQCQKGTMLWVGRMQSAAAQSASVATHEGRLTSPTMLAPKPTAAGKTGSWTQGRGKGEGLPKSACASAGLAAQVRHMRSQPTNAMRHAMLRCAVPGAVLCSVLTHGHARHQVLAAAGEGRHHGRHLDLHPGDHVNLCQAATTADDLAAWLEACAPACRRRCVAEAEPQYGGRASAPLAPGRSRPPPARTAPAPPLPACPHPTQEDQPSKVVRYPRAESPSGGWLIMCSRAAALICLAPHAPGPCTPL